MALGVHPLDPEMLDRPLVDLVATWAGELPGEPAYTYVDYTADPDGSRQTLTWSRAHRRARAMAARLREVVEPGERVALLMPQCLDYVTSMLGAMYAGVIAVPLFSPDLPGHGERLVRAYADADAACVLTTTGALDHVRSFLDEQSAPLPKEIVTADTVEMSLAAGWRPDPADVGRVAYLQYTSGSTRQPAGVEITHRNLMANALQMWHAFDARPRVSSLVGWIPLFHDMGLVSTLAAPVVYGNHAVFTDPVAFVMHPHRWLRLVSEGEDVFTAGPNFAYEYCVARVTDEEKASLDLSGVRGFLNGAEPIRPSTLTGFAEAFDGAGLRTTAQSPGYGLAEATVCVSVAARDEPRVTAFDREALAEGTARPCDPGHERAVALVSCGFPVGQHVAIVDAATCTEALDGTVGEIWVNGPNVAPGYWRNPEKTAEVFGAVLEGAADGLPATDWLRTGDLGVVHEGELYVTGRIKDLIVVDGRNRYPQDLEATVQEAHPAVRRDHVAAFSVPGSETERVVIVAERSRHGTDAGADEVARAVRGAVSTVHEVRVHDFVLVQAGGVPRTSSGKIARAACRLRYLAEELPWFSGADATAR